MNYYPHHIGDFMRDTANLSDSQLATYLRMTWAYYLSEKPFTDAPEDIAFAVRSDEKTVQLLLRHYFVKQDDGWHQKRSDIEIDSFRAKGEKRRGAANVRWGNANALQTKSTSKKKNANQEPITNNQEPITNTKDTVAGFSDDLDLGEVAMPMNDAERELGVHLALVKPKPVKAKSPEFFEIPDWINRAHWDAWHSCAKRKKATPEQKQMAVDKLDQWRREGVDFAAALESAALAGWQGLFKPDDRKASTTTFSNRNTNKYAGAAAAIWGNDAPLDERTINV